MQQQAPAILDLGIDEVRMQKLPIIDSENPHRKYTEKEEKHLRDICTYEFMNLEQNGAMVQFCYGNTKNKHTFSLFHGGRYRIPRFLANHVNNRSTPNWDWQPDGSGKMRKVRVGTKSRFQMREVY